MNAELIKKIDKIDQKLLKELVHNSRMPISLLSKKLGISKQACHYRLKRLVEEDIITGFKAKINSAMLGYSSYCIYFKLIDITEEQENALISNITSKEYVRWFVTCTGRWDIMVAFSAKNNIAYNIRMKELLKIIGNKILHYETSIILATYDLWLKDRITLRNDLQESTSDIVIGKTLDETDEKILNVLQQDCRTTATAIASAVNLTPEAVIYRIKRLQKEKIIHSFAVSVNKEKLGLTWYQIQFLLRNIDEAEEKKLLSRLKMIDSVEYIVWMIGKWNFEINMYCKSISEFRANLMKIRSLLSDYIREYDTNIILKKYKSRTFAE
jgi:DNA-binding Lrp family transcriptional regulator